MDIYQFTIEIIKYAAWPIVAIISVFVLKDKISNLFSGGIKTATFGDNTLEFYKDQQDVIPKTAEINNLDHLIPGDITGLREKQEDVIKSQLPNNVDDAVTIDVLIKNLAQQQIVNVFEKIYYSIFGSQIQLLDFLASQDEGKSDTGEIFSFYKDAKEKYPVGYKDSDFSHYMNFLLVFDLVQNIGAEWIITDKGRAFMRYITAVQLEKNKAL